MDNVLVNKETLQKLLDYMSESEARDYEECKAMDWEDSELSNHAFSLIQELQDCINAQ